MHEREMAQENKILLMNHGSFLYGTNTPTSDTDHTGIFVADKEYYIGLKSVEQVDLSIKSKAESGKNNQDAVDVVLYEVRKFIRLAADNNPNILEMLFVNEPNLIECNALGRILLDSRHLFVHRGLYHRFVGYAYSQRSKMVLRTERHHELFAAIDYMKQLDDVSSLCELKVKDLPFLKFGSMTCKTGDIEIPNNVTIKRAISVIQDRIDRVGNRKEVITQHGYDSKFGSHLIRLLLEGKELLETGNLTFPLKEKDLVLDIKLGKYNLKQVLDLSDSLENEINIANEKSELPKYADQEKLNELCCNLVTTFLSRGKLY